jgi:hypothetical protein
MRIFSIHENHANSSSWYQTSVKLAIETITSPGKQAMRMIQQVIILKPLWLAEIAYLYPG